MTLTQNCRWRPVQTRRFLRTKPFILTESRMSTFFVELGGAVGSIAWGARNTRSHPSLKFAWLPPPPIPPTSTPPTNEALIPPVGRLPTGHVHHAAVAVVHQVARFAVNATGGDAVTVEEIRVHGRGLAVAPGGGQINQLQQGHVTCQEQRRLSGKLSLFLVYGRKK